MSTVCQLENIAERGDCINLFGMRINRTTMADSVAAVLGWCREPRGEACKFVVTPNTDHAVVYQQHAGLRAAYADASMVLADGTPLVVAANFFGKNLPERVAGSDLVPQIFAGACSRPLPTVSTGGSNSNLRVFYSARRQASPTKRGVESKLNGRASASLVRIHRRSASKPILKKMPGSLPPCGRSSRTSSLLGSVRRGRSFGFIKHQRELPAKAAICAGATIDFLAGHKRRSPSLDAQCGARMATSAVLGTASIGDALRARCLGAASTALG